jgi:phage baseplate assembly protein W
MPTDQHLGQGLSFPPRIGEDGRMVWSSGDQNIRESIRVILLTNRLERLRLPEFGGSLQQFLFEPNTVATRSLIQDRIEKALARWEPRVAVESVKVDPDPEDPEAALATIIYRSSPPQARERVTLSVTLASLTSHAMPIQIPRSTTRPTRNWPTPPCPHPGPHPEWTNLIIRSGATWWNFRVLTERFYRANQIPERNRRKFCRSSASGCSLASSARGLVRWQRRWRPCHLTPTRTSRSAPAGSVPHRVRPRCPSHRSHPLTTNANLTETDPALLEYYEALYASFRQDSAPPGLKLYETVPLSTAGDQGVDLGETSVDQALWIAVLLRSKDKPAADYLEVVRRELAGKTLSLGLVPVSDPLIPEVRLPPGGRANDASSNLVRVELPSVPADGRLPTTGRPAYRTLTHLSCPGTGVIEITLPDAEALRLWSVVPASPGHPPASMTPRRRRPSLASAGGIGAAIPSSGPASLVCSCSNAPNFNEALLNGTGT